MKKNLTILPLFLIVFCLSCKQEKHSAQDSPMLIEQPKPETLAVVDTAKNVMVDTSLIEKQKTTLENNTNASIAKKQVNIASEQVEKTAKVKEQKPSGETVKVAPQPATSGKAQIAFDQTTIPFGLIEQGEVVNRSFNFRNTGSAPLQIIGADVTCGCTYPAYPFDPIEPGKTGKIDVTFNSKGKFGEQKPVVTLRTNAGVHKLYLEGRVNAELQPVTPATKIEEKPN